MIKVAAAAILLVLPQAMSFSFSLMKAYASKVMDEGVPEDQQQREVQSRGAFDSVVMKTYGRYPITRVSGDGATLTDSIGKTYLDFVAGIATCALGHNHPAIIKAVTDQIRQVHHVSNLYFIPQQGALAQWLVEHSRMDKVFFCNSGAEANEAAIKLARKHAHTKLGYDEPVIITALDSFHGRTLGALSATAQPKYQKDFGPMLSGFEHVAFNDVAGLEALVLRVNRDGRKRAKGLRGLLGNLACWRKPTPSRRGVAAIMLEALQGEGGIKAGDPAFFQKARELCDVTGALLIFDEVPMWASA
jgi:acetylornithine aminotransferase